MIESTGVIQRTDEADAEIELNTEELLALSKADRTERDQMFQPSRTATSALALAPKAQSAQTDGPSSTSRLLPVLVLLVSLVAAFVVNNSDRADQPTTDTSQQGIQSDRAVAQLVESEPVRFPNPFDSDEVFEFPSGTTETEAREAVAALLLERAISRQKI